MFDAYVRLSIANVHDLQVTHIHSELEDMLPAQADQAQPMLQGFTEWSAPGDRAISFGWDWTFEPDKNRLLARWTTLRTNLMLIDESGTDLGNDCMRLCVARLMTRACWEDTISGLLGLQLKLRH
jgi:hypothetical protein